MRIFVTKRFDRFAAAERITDVQLYEAIERAEKGLVDAHLGANLIKQRVSRSGQGKSGGYRTIIALKHGDRAIFLHGFAKNESENISPAQLAELKLIGSRLLGLDERQTEDALKNGFLLEKKYEERTRL